MASRGRQMTSAVSVCIPAYRAEAFIGETIRSVLAQQHQDWELVVVDNASDDETAEVVRGFDDDRIRVVVNDRNLGAIANWNLAVSLTRHSLVKLLCADDLLRPECLGVEAHTLDLQPGVALVAGRRDFIDAESNVVARARGLQGLVGRQSPQGVRKRVARCGYNPIGEPSATMFRREAFDATSGFTDDFPYAMDLDLWLRLLDHGDMIGLADTLSAFRVSPSSGTAGLISVQSRHQRQLLRWLARAYPGDVGRLDVASGLILSHAHSLVRRRLLARARAADGSATWNDDQVTAFFHGTSAEDDVDGRGPNSPADRA